MCGRFSSTKSQASIRTKHKYFVTVLKYIFQVPVLYVSISFYDEFLLLLATFLHKYL